MTKGAKASIRALGNEKGVSLELVRGDGYCYIVYDESNGEASANNAHWTTRSVMAPRISDLTVDMWLWEANELLNEVEVAKGRPQLEIGEEPLRIRI